MNSVLLRRALSDPGDPLLRPLPEQVEAILENLDAPPRLGAHLRAVHDVAWQLTDWGAQKHSAAQFDRTAVLFGAATHDIGKIRHPDELSGPGSAHERTGYELLLAQGFDDSLARFTQTHGTWAGADVGLEDLLVALADKIWKAKRVPELEQLVVHQLAAVNGRQPWQVFMELDDELDRIAADADQRLTFQSNHPVVPRHEERRAAG